MTVPVKEFPACAGTARERSGLAHGWQTGDDSGEHVASLQ